MANRKKLGYTWFYKDWTNSESVFVLNLEERGLYRELIDLAMQNDNKIPKNIAVWCRKWNCEERVLLSLLASLIESKLITETIDTITIPSCESRLQMVRGGSKGGQKSKPISKGIGKGIGKQSKVKESKVKIKVKEKVFLLQSEIDKLKLKYPKKYELIITTLNNYKLAHGRNYKSDYGAINSWVVGSCTDEKTINKKPILDL